KKTRRQSFAKLHANALVTNRPRQERANRGNPSLVISDQRRFARATIVARKNRRRSGSFLHGGETNVRAKKVACHDR
ncbi:MAG TPA: hypothetical protein VGJ01_13580, partial [Pseudolabrys sp.]